MAHFLVAPFVPHRKAQLIENCGLSRASFYRAVEDLNRFKLIEEIDGNLKWAKTELGNCLIRMGIAATHILWEEEHPEEF
jgi:hypothetical protein